MIASRAIANYRQLREQPLWRLLAADHGPAIMALLQTHLLDANRALPASVLFERLARDLETLRDRGEDLPQTPQAYVANWLSAGFVTRRFPADTSEEVYELTTAAATAIRFVNGLIERHTAATESRLATVIQQLVRLAEETESDPRMRLRALEAERDRIDREIERVRSGHVDLLPEDRAVERARETVALAGELAGDFRRVRDNFHQLNRELRERVMDSEGSRGEVLGELFAGVDVIAESDAGRTFYAFWRLLTDPEQSATLEEALDQVLARDFASHLHPRERRFLRQLVKTLLDQGGMVHEVLQNLARSLKQFVQSREYLEQRRMTQLIKEAQRAALILRDQIKTSDTIDYHLQLTTSRLRSVDQWVLYDPSLNAIETGVLPGDEATADLEQIGELVAHSEIDFRSLKESIRNALRNRSPVTIGQIIEEYPAAQGLGSVVGYIALGSRHGQVTPEQIETVAWQGEDGPWRRVRIPKVYFWQERLDELV